MVRTLLLILLFACTSSQLAAQTVASVASTQAHSTAASDKDVLTVQQWQRVDLSVDRALAWLAKQQRPNGSFNTRMQGQPGVTSLCAMAFLAHGHLPGDGVYGDQLNRAINFVISGQKPNGLISLVGPQGEQISRNVPYELGVSTVYNHAISSLLLSEVYGVGDAEQADRLQPIIEKSLEASLQIQAWPKVREIDNGGWRYLKPYNNARSDLSLTGWQLMFLRSAKNSGFDVPQEPIDQAIGYVRRCFDRRYRVFVYTVQDGDGRSRAMAGAGVLAFAHAGLHNTDEARESGDWILKHDFDQYNQTVRFTRKYPKDRYHYGVFNCSQAMYQLGDKYWQQFFPRLVKTLLDNQASDGSWQAENHYEDKKFGNAYTTSLVVLALGAPNQFLPVFQR